MSEPFLGEIRIWGCNFAPRGWAFCAGQLLSIAQHTALFSLLGTTYGGDGRTTFALPNLQSCAPMFWGKGPGLSDYSPGQAGGTPTVTLTESQVPAHTHALMASPDDATYPGPSPQRSLARSSPFIYKQPAGASQPQPLAPGAIGTTGGGQPHTNMMPYVVLNFCIALVGMYPPRP